MNEPFRFERQSWDRGFWLVAGGDEAGRGPWAGPVFAAFVVLPRECGIKGIDDSKKLTRGRRIELYSRIRESAVCFGIGSATSAESDRINILEATRLAFARAFEQLHPLPDFVLLDHLKLPWLRISSLSITKGDTLSISIAAASILAKEARDRHMEDLDKKFPGYGFASHKGYGTIRHREALWALGPCPIHRYSFKPVKKVIESGKPHETLF